MNSEISDGIIIIIFVTIITITSSSSNGVSQLQGKREAQLSKGSTFLLCVPCLAVKTAIRRGYSEFRGVCVRVHACFHSSVSNQDRSSGVTPHSGDSPLWQVDINTTCNRDGGKSW